MIADDDISELIDSYWKWMRDRTILKAVSDGWTEVNTPFLDRHNDGLQLYVKKIGDRVEITDDGHAIEDLRRSGCKISTNKQKALLDTILNSASISLEDGSFRMVTSVSDFPSRKNDFITAMQDVDDLFMTSRTNVYTLFADEVATWIDSQDVPHSRNVKIMGEGGISYALDFLFPKYRGMPEYAMQAINAPTKEKIAWTIVVKNGLKNTRGIDVHAMLNDTDMSPGTKKSFLKLGESHGVICQLWNSRESVASVQ